MRPRDDRGRFIRPWIVRDREIVHLDPARASEPEIEWWWGWLGVWGLAWALVGFLLGWVAR